MREWIVPDNDIGVDGAYFDYQELLRCKDCKKRTQCKDCKKRTQCKVATEYFYCSMTGEIVGKSDFCSWAERKEE